MKKIIISILFMLVNVCFYAQNTFEKGYFINNFDQKKEGLIKNYDWKNNPDKIEYKDDQSVEPRVIPISDIREFGLLTGVKFIRSKVKLDRSSENIYNLTNVKDPIFNEEEIFLRVLVEGDANLYVYDDGNLRKFFFSKKGLEIEQLIFKTYLDANREIKENNKFKQQLWNNLKCSSFTMDTFNDLQYKKNNLEFFFINYNKCQNPKYVNNFEKSQGKTVVVSIRPRISYSRLNIDNSLSNYRDIELDGKFGFGFGIETECVLPFNNRKWGLFIEPIYQNYKSEKTTISNEVIQSMVTISIDYKSIDFPVGLRYYSYLNNDSKMFFDVAYVYSLSINSSIKYDTTGGSIIYDPLDISNGDNLALGVGYKFKENYSIELRANSKRGLLKDYAFWDAGYYSYSLILGYSFF